MRTAPRHITQPDYEGWIKKKSRHVRKWRTRWMVLERGWLLTFKKEGSYEEPTETIDLREVKNIVLLGQHGHGFNFALSTASEQETDYFEFCIETEEEMIKWKDSISDQMTR